MRCLVIACLLLFALSVCALASGLTPSIRTGAYLCGADNVPDADVFQREAGDDSIFFKRYEVLLGIGSGMAGYLDEMWKYGCWSSYYTSPYDMPPGSGGFPTGDLLYDIKHSFFTKDSVGDQWWLHCQDATCRQSGTQCVDGVGSPTPTDADSVNRLWYYDSKYWGGNTYTYNTRPVYNFMSLEGKQRQAEFAEAILVDSIESWFPERTATGDTMYAAIYWDNFASAQFNSAGVSSGGSICEMNGLVVGTDAARDSAWNHMKLMMFEARKVQVNGDSLRIGINVGSAGWNDDYMNAIPRGSIVNFEYGFDLLQVKSKPPTEINWVWIPDSLAKYDSTACANGITFFYCACGFDAQGSYYNSVRDYHGFSNARWSVYSRAALYYVIRSDSSVLYCMPDYYGGAYEGYAFDGRSHIYYDWDAQDTARALNQSFDTLAWCPAFERDIGSPLGMMERDTSWSYIWPPGGDGHWANIYSREYDSAWVFIRPMDDATIHWGHRAHDDGIAGTVRLPDTVRLLLPDNTLSDSSFLAYEMNPGDGFVFIKASGYEEPEPPATPTDSLILKGTTFKGVTIGHE